jgi:adenine-specific DNA-methyltransferase
LLRNIIGEQNPFSYPKSIFTLEDALYSSDLGKSDIVIDYFAGSGTTAHAIINLNKDGGNRTYILMEMGDYFYTVLKPRIQKVMFSKEWKDGVPQSTEGHSHMFKYMYLEQYEDTLSNIVFRKKDKTIQETLQTYDDYFIRYMLDYETQGSPTRLSTGDFEDPFAYKIKTVSGNEEKTVSVDLVETFNYLIGLWVDTIRAKKDGDRYYKAVRGKTRDEKSVLVVWRSTKGIDLKRDKKFIEDNFLEGKKPDILYVNGMCHVEGSQSIEPDFKRLMGA